MATCLIFVGLGWTGDVYQPMALCVGGMVCIAAANAGATSQDLKTGYIVGATPRHQQIGLMIGAVAAAIVIGLTMKVLDNPTVDPATGAVVHSDRVREVSRAAGDADGDAHQGTARAQPRLAVRAGRRVPLGHDQSSAASLRSPSRWAPTCRSRPRCPSSSAA